MFFVKSYGSCALDFYPEPTTGKTYMKNNTRVSWEVFLTCPDSTTPCGHTYDSNIAKLKALKPASGFRTLNT